MGNKNVNNETDETDKTDEANPLNDPNIAWEIFLKQMKHFLEANNLKEHESKMMFMYFWSFRNSVLKDAIQFFMVETLKAPLAPDNKTNEGQLNTQEKIHILATLDTMAQCFGLGKMADEVKVKVEKNVEDAHDALKLMTFEDLMGEYTTKH